MKEVKTEFPGIYRILDGYRIRAYARDPRTGRNREVVKTLEGANLQDALKARRLLRAELLEPLLPQVVRMTLSAYARRWIEDHARRDRFSTLDMRVRTLENHLLPALGNVYLDELTPLMIKEWLTKAATTKRRGGTVFAARTVNGWLRILKAMVRSAIVDLDLPKDPTRAVRALPEGGYGDEEGNALTSEEVSGFLAEARTLFPDRYAMILLGMTTGMRFSELSALHWDSVDLEKGIVFVRRSQVRGHVGLPKTGKGRRVPILPQVAEVLREHKFDLEGRGFSGLSAGLVFPTEKGGYHSITFLAKPFEKLRKAAGINRRFTPHGMRRTFNTLMVEAGVDRVVLWATIGHSSERMTEHYAFVGDAAKRQATDRAVKLLRFPIGSKPGVEEDAVA